MMKKKKNVRFIKRNGRVIPIAVSVAGAGLGVTVGGLEAASDAKRKWFKSVEIAKMAVMRRSKPIADLAVKTAQSSFRLKKLSRIAIPLGLGLYGLGVGTILKNGYTASKRRKK